MQFQTKLISFTAYDTFFIFNKESTKSLFQMQAML